MTSRSLPARIGAVAGVGALSWLVVAGAGVAVGGATRSTAVPRPARAPQPAAYVAPRSTADPSEQPAVALLERAARASRTLTYTATQSVTQWSAGGPTGLLLHVTHIPGVGLLARSARTATGGGAATLLAAGELRGGDLSVTADQVSLLQANYRLAVEPSSTVDGRMTDVVTAARAGGGVRARFWLDHSTGLVLRRELYDDQGRLARVSTFLDVDLSHPAPQQPVASMPAVRPAAGTPLDAVALAAQARRGFRTPVQLAGGFRVVDARLLQTRHATVLHVTYSDGLTTLSVFEQRGRLDAASLVGWHPAALGPHRVLRAQGMPARVAWSAAGIVYTLVGSGTQDDLDDVVAAWPRTEHRAGLVRRLTRGLARIGSWLNPFG